MNKDLFTILRCPRCKNADYTLERGSDTKSFAITCPHCKTAFPINNDVPDFMIENESNEKINNDVKQANLVYHDAIAAHYDDDLSTLAIKQPYTQSRIREIMDSGSTSSGNNLFVDLGCGTGNLLAISKDYFKWSIGADISKGMLAAAREQGYDVVRGDIENLPIKSGTANVTACCSVLHHLYKPAALFSESFRILKPGGLLYTDYDPNKTSKELQNAWLFRVAKLTYEALHRNTHNSSKDKSISEALKMAEYHHNIESGLDIKVIEKDLLAAGFIDVKVIPHGNCPSLKKNSFRYIPMTSKLEIAIKFLISWKLDYSYLAPQFLILARKPS